MTLVQSWKDSVQLLKPKNLKLFAMVTLKSIIEAYKIYLKYFWWMILLVVLCAIAPYFIQLQDYAFSNIQYKHIFFYTSCWLYELLFLAACFSTRPSILQKDSNYFVLQFKKIILFWIFMPLFSWSSATYYGYIFTVLFFADSEGGPKNFLLSLWKALKMIFFNLPLILIVGVAIYVSGLIGIQCLAQLLALYNIPVYPYLFLFVNLLGALLLPMSICTYTNIYIKRLHDQFDLYFKQPE
jgi:hypothetical protein